MTIQAEKFGDGFRISLPGNFIKIVQNRKDLKRMLNPYQLCDDRFAKFESDLLKTGNAIDSIAAGKGFQG